MKKQILFSLWGMIYFFPFFICANEGSEIAVAQREVTSNTWTEFVITLEDPEKECSPMIVNNDGVTFPGCIPFEKKLATYLYRYLNRSVSMAGVDRIRKGIVEFYKDKGLPFVTVNFPSGQEVTGGKLTAELFIAKVGTVEVKGARWFSNQKIKNMLTLKQGY